MIVCCALLCVCLSASALIPSIRTPSSRVALVETSCSLSSPHIYLCRDVESVVVLLCEIAGPQ
jgi:hypothetical protein